MRVYLLQRLAAMILTLLGVSLLIFGMIRLVPGTVVEQLLGQAAIASPEVLAAFRRFFGLDRPAHVQYLDWLAAVLRGDFGVSWLSGRPVLALFLERVPVSAELAVLAVAWSLVIGIPLGTGSAVWRGAVRDGVIRVIATLGLSLPAFWQGTVLILLFSIYLGWMPSLQWVPFTYRPSVNLLTMALPALTLGTATAAMITRMSRSTMLDVLGREYVRTARAKGLPERRVTFHHALRNALIPVVTVAGVQLGYIVGGIVVVEDVFTLPGVGRLLLDAIFQRDYPVVQGVILLLAAASIAAALVAGGALGLLAGFGRGVDQVLGRAMDVFFAFPPVLLAIGIAAVLGAGPGTAVVAIAVVYAPLFFRVVRASVLAESAQAYVEAAEALGLGRLAILVSHILPNVVSPIVVQTAVCLSYGILIESALSYLGLGVQPPTPSWGTILNEGKEFLAQAPWVSLFPGGAIMLAVLAFNVIGDGLRDALDPRSALR